MKAELRIGILGPLEVWVNDLHVPIGPFKQRIVLGLLAARPNAVVPVDLLLDALWGEQQPRTARKNLQVYVSTLRKILWPADADPDAGQRLRHDRPGYQLRLALDELDAHRFGDLARAGRLALRGGNPVAATKATTEALRLWRGPALADFLHVPAVAEAAADLEEARLEAYEDWLEGELSLGHHSLVLDIVADLVRHHPLRERLRTAQLVALYRSGRQADAVAGFEEVRCMLASRLGLPPSPALARLYQLMLAGDASLDVPTAPPEASISAAQAKPVQLPHDIHDFTGRHRVVHEVLATLSSENAHDRTVVIWGGPGTGKTTLAVHVAHLLQHRFPDGQILTRLCTPGAGPRSADDVLGEILRRLGFTGRMPRQLDDRAALYRDFVAGRTVLVLLDDAVDEAQVRPLLPAPGQVAVLLTSRRPLEGLQCRLRPKLAAFTVEEAVTLLARIAGHDRIGREACAATEIVKACGLLPLAVRIAGARLAGASHLAASRFVTRLADPQRILAELTVGDQSMRACAASYFGDLPPAQRAAAHRLGLLSGAEFSAATFAALAGADIEDTSAVLDSLAAAGIVQSAVQNSRSPAYHVADWMRAYARETTRTG